MRIRRMALGSILLITVFGVPLTFPQNSSGSMEKEPYPSNRKPNAYVAFGIGSAAALLGGTDIGVGMGIGANVEGGFFGTESTRAGFFSPGISYHPWKDSKIDLFVNSGYTLAFDSRDREGLFHIGGGFNQWYSRKMGLRLEIRDHICSHSGNVNHTWQVRIGLAFR